MPTPRKSRAFGGSAAHQRLMMANLAASLFAAEAIVTTEAKAKALRPVAEKLITKAKKAQDEGPMRVHRIRQIQGYLGDREMTHKLVNDVAPRYIERNGGYTRILKLGARRRHRRDGAHRAGLTVLSFAHGPIGPSPNDRIGDGACRDGSSCSPTTATRSTPLGAQPAVDLARRAPAWRRRRPAPRRSPGSL